MNILVLCKRRYMGRDLIAERYGRFFHIPVELAARSHTVEVLCLDYHPGKGLRREAGEDGVGWTSLPAMPWGLFSYRKRAVSLGRRIGAAVVLGMSDAPYGIWAHKVASELKVPFVFDLYDDFETYSSMRLPGVAARYARALQEATVVGCVSEALGEHVKGRHGPKGRMIILPNAAAPEFRPLERLDCRREWGLPERVPIVGYTGEVRRDRGIEDLFLGFERLRRRRPDALLVLAGRLQKGLRLPLEGIRYLGNLPPGRVPLLLNAFDLGAVVVSDTAFGRHCDPQKMREYAAVGIPMLATNFGAATRFLAGRPGCLYERGNAEDWATKADALLEGGRLDYGPLPTWAANVAILERALLAAAP